MPRITIDASQWFRGMSTTNDLTDGGFSPNSVPISLFATPGVIRPSSGYFQATSQFQSNGIFGWATPPGASTTQYGLTSNSSQDGYVVTMDANTIGSVSTVYGPDTARNYAAGYSDLVYYKGNYYWSSTTDIARNGTFNWWTGTLGLTALGATDYHLMVVFGDILYIADGRYVHSYDGTTGTYNALDLPEDYRITAMTVYNGMMYLAADIFQDNAAGSRTGTAKLFTWDGFSSSWIEEEDIKEHVSVLFPHGGTLFMCTGTHFGYFNGSAFIPLRKISSAVLKHQITVTNDVILLVQSQHILAYGNPIPGRQKFFSYPCYGQAAVQGIHALRSNGTFSASLGTTQARFDLYNTGVTFEDPPFELNKIPLGDYAYIRKFTLELLNNVASGEGLTISYTNSAGSSVSVGSVTNAIYGGLKEIVLDVENDLPTFTVQPKIVFGNNVNGLRRLHIDYEFSEDRPSI